MAYGKQSPLERFWAWWWPSLLAWLPAGARPSGSPDTPRFLHWNGETFAETAPHPAGASADTVILLPRQMALVRRLRMPAAARSRLRQAASLEIERQTPFAPDAVCFDALPHPSVTADAATFEATLAVAQKVLVETAVNAAVDEGIHPVAVDVEDAQGIPLGINLLPGRLRPAHSARWQRWNIALSLICLLASCGTLIGLLHARQRAITDLQTRFQPLREQAADTLHREHALASLERLRATAVGNGQPTSLELLAELSKRLPADTHLLQMRLSEGSISLRAQTGDLASALQGLRKSPLWDEPGLTGSRTLPDNRSQEFSVTLTLKTPPAEDRP